MRKKVFALNIEERNKFIDGRTSRNSAKYRTLHFPMGFGLILGALKATEKYDLSVLDNYVGDLTFNDILQEVELNIPNYILLTGFLGNYQYRFMKQAIATIKNASPTSKVIIGGPMASCIPELLMEKTELDFVVAGEGEDTIVDLLDHLDYGKEILSCPGIVHRAGNGTIVRNSPRLRMKDLGKYPTPPYELFNTNAYAKYVKTSNRCWEISTSRGCYAKCTYCRLTFGQKISFRPFEHLFEEMTTIIEQYGINRFNFVDDNFLNSPRQVLEFIEQLRCYKYPIQFRFQGRADRLSPDLAKGLSEVGCFDVSMGLESGSEIILEEMDKRMDLEKAKKNIAGVLAEGVSIHATFIVGMPSESFETIETTLNFIRDAGLPYVAAGILTPFPDTRLYDLAKEKGLIPDDDKYCEELGPVYEIPYVNLTQHSDEQLLRWQSQIDSLSQSSNFVADSGFQRA